MPWRATVTSCTVRLGETAWGAVWAAATRSIPAPASSVASCWTRWTSASVSGPPSARFTTPITVAADACGNAVSASSWAWTDS
jgi:hypothetical protein